MPLLEEHDGCVHIAVKAVPGASRDQIAGVLGERLKVRVSAPPEGGRANDSICRLIAEHLGVRGGVRVVRGHAHAEKVLSVSGLPLERVRTLLEL